MAPSNANAIASGSTAAPSPARTAATPARGKLPGDTAEAGAEWFHRQRQRPCRERRDNDRDQNAGPMRPLLPEDDDDGDADGSHRNR